VQSSFALCTKTNNQTAEGSTEPERVDRTTLTIAQTVVVEILGAVPIKLGGHALIPHLVCAFGTGILSRTPLTQTFVATFGVGGHCCASISLFLFLLCGETDSNQHITIPVLPARLGEDSRLYEDCLRHKFANAYDPMKHRQILAVILISST
jgi:hypothetical protein